MSKRPNYYDENIIRKVAQKFLPQISKWTEGYGTEAELEIELSDALRRTAPYSKGTRSRIIWKSVTNGRAIPT